MIPSLIQKKTHKSSWLILMSVLPFSISIIWPPHVSPFLGVHLRFKLWPLCSPLSVVIYSFCSLNIRSRFLTKSWSTLFSSSPFGSHDRSFDPSVVNEEPALAMGSFSFGIVAFPKFVSFGVSLLSRHFHLCPKRVFDLSWPIQIFKRQFSIIDQILDLVFECGAIFCRMTWIPIMLVVSSVGIVPSWKWGSERCQLNWFNVTNLY